jgi:hypothetical protein
MANTNTAAKGKATFAQHMLAYLRRQKRKGDEMSVDAAIQFCVDWDLRQLKNKKKVVLPPKKHPAAGK